MRLLCWWRRSKIKSVVIVKITPKFTTIYSGNIHICAQTLIFLVSRHTYACTYRISKYHRADKHSWKEYTLEVCIMSTISILITNIGIRKVWSLKSLIKNYGTKDSRPALYTAVAPATMAIEYLKCSSSKLTCHKCQTYTGFQNLLWKRRQNISFIILY